MALVPLDDSNLDSIVGPGAGEALGDFRYPTPALVEWLRRTSRRGDPVHLETDYFGGDGDPGAAVFRSRETALPPRRCERGIIDETLARVGAELRPGGSDRFEALRLGDFRSNEDRRAAAAVNGDGHPRDQAAGL